MKKRLYVDFHVLQTVPPSCINRDDTGSPKTAVYGGVTRARVSSQAWKHAMRQAFIDESLLDEEDVGKRTKKVAELVEKEIAALAPDADAAKLAKKVDAFAAKRWNLAHVSFSPGRLRRDSLAQCCVFSSQLLFCTV